MENPNLLSSNIKPKNYELFLKIDIEEKKFQGKVDIKMNILKETKVLELHSLDLEIDTETVKLGNLKCSKLEYDQKRQTILLFFDEFVVGNDLVLGLGFQGKLSDKMSGIYYSSYKFKNETKIMAVTQFEPTDARRA